VPVQSNAYVRLPRSAATSAGLENDSWITVPSPPGVVAARLAVGATFCTVTVAVPPAG
jgi:hypothetical protein